MGKVGLKRGSCFRSRGGHDLRESCGRGRGFFEDGERRFRQALPLGLFRRFVCRGAGAWRFGWEGVIWEMFGREGVIWEMFGWKGMDLRKMRWGLLSLSMGVPLTGSPLIGRFVFFSRSHNWFLFYSALFVEREVCFSGRPL